MIANSAFLAALIVLLLVMSLLGELQYLVPYKRVIAQYLPLIGGAVGLVFLNLFAMIYSLARLLFLKNTGRKLAHVEKQLRAGDGVARELADRLEDED
jgi:hypothetical protein